MKLRSLTPNLVRGLYRWKLDGDPEKGVKSLSPRSVNYIHVTLHKALKQALSDGLVPRNAAQVKAPQPGKPEIHPLSQDQARKLIATAHDEGDRFESLYVVALHTGLREGELLGLKWDDLDLDAATPTLQVRRTLSETRTGHKFELPKSGKGRSVKLSRSAVEALRSHRVRQNEKLRKGSRWQDEGLMFPNTIGTTMSGTNLLWQQFRPLLKRAGLPPVRFHDLRHTCATILLRAGKHPKYVQEMFGHANISRLCRLLGESDFQQTETRGFGSVCSMLETDRYCLTVFSTWTRLGFDRHFSRITKNATEPISITLDTYSHVIEGMDGGLEDAMDDALG